MPYGQDVLSFFVCYLIGALPCSYLVARWRAGVDIRERGEGNVGARNVYHVVGPGWGLAAALLDIAKGLLAWLCAARLVSALPSLMLSGAGAILGHAFSPFLGFRGGKGVATATGFMLGLAPLSTLSGVALYGLAYLIVHDANKALVAGILGVVLLQPAFGSPLVMVPYAASLYALTAVKKALDRKHERAVWARDPWRRGQPGLYGGDEERGP